MLQDNLSCGGKIRNTSCTLSLKAMGLCIASLNMTSLSSVADYVRGEWIGTGVVTLQPAALRVAIK